ncbi:hypothetical protein M0R45_005148 [Rubus argutus]|uniref:Uncharacterized protein n=1 Tax=Rubus argutus TaxID=59490 RepID=A0AAW1YLV5_RUBAR
MSIEPPEHVGVVGGERRDQRVGDGEEERGIRVEEGVDDRGIGGVEAERGDAEGGDRGGHTLGGWRVGVGCGRGGGVGTPVRDLAYTLPWILSTVSCIVGSLSLITTIADHVADPSSSAEPVLISSTGIREERRDPSPITAAPKLSRSHLRTPPPLTARRIMKDEIGAAREEKDGCKDMEER